ncbi:MAG: hypothetical protein H6826_04165 [Planctomycetes bacterium]|nr:hypothetical protein [Planctomycetota bacterium]MCB9824532.1 hypothetical protein [Planctomycetota bacterium]MCB9900528.1 hypothetical protein [Planctomycetota bacterium]
MANQTYGRKRRSGAGSTATAIAITLLAVCGGALLLHSTGAITLPFLSADAPPPAREPDHTGQVAVALTTQAIPSYTMLRREHFLSATAGGILYRWFPEKDVPKTVIRSAGELYGRVLRGGKEAVQWIDERDLYPPGTREGPTAGIPPGKRAMRLRASDIPGLHGLNQGDRFDIVMTTEVEIEAPKRVNRSRVDDLDVEGPYAPLHTADMRPAPEAPTIKRRMAEVKLVVEGGTVVQPVHRREDLPGAKTPVRPNLRNKPLEEIVIAVDPAEVAALEQALALGAKIQVAMRAQAATGETNAGRIPDIEVAVEDLMPTPATPDTDTPKERVRLVEVVEGGVKKIKAVPIGPQETRVTEPSPENDVEEPAPDDGGEDGEEESAE